MNSYKNFLVKILKIINYKKDIDEYVNNFVAETQTQAFLKLIEKLDQETVDDLKIKLDNYNGDSKQIELALKKHLSQKQIQETYKDCLQENLKIFLKSIENSITEDQKEEITKLAEENI